MNQIKTTKMSLTDKVILNHHTAVGLPAGLSLKTEGLPIGFVIKEGTPVTAPTQGIREICKQAKVLAEDGTAITIHKNHPFKVGDRVLLASDTNTNSTTISSIVADSVNSENVVVTLAADPAPTAGKEYFMVLATASNEPAQTADMLLKFHAIIESSDYVLFDLAAYTQNVQLEAGHTAPNFLEDLKNFAIREIKY